MELIRRTRNRWLARYAAFVAFATFLLIIAGALVTSNDAGLSVPDWPTSFGTFRMPRMVGGVKYEHGHRMIAGTVGLLTIFLALWLWRSDERRWVRRLGGLAVLTVIAQAVLGGITVLFFLPAPISVAHACLAQLFFCITVSLALFTRYDWHWDGPRAEDAGSPSLRQLAAATTAAIFLQLMLGAAFRHDAFGIIPHVIGAVVVTVGILWLLVRVLAKHQDDTRLVRSAVVLTVLLAVQVLLGIGSYIERLAELKAPQPLPPAVTVTTTHVAVGALVLAASLVVTLEVFRTFAASGHAVRVAETAPSGDGLAHPSRV
ncbi:MAG TPA: COX15/CtaA family protein [Terriglobia bacterium]|nr:COX15/CtaA family protein [Terriglobia bacterium]